ncbi:hypothetical protein KM043_001975 [Ampulex compressa]|nr:hypothetical protein KM043_001975 [Ampulex compressa]
MNRGSKCIAQTINLSNPKSCVRPKRVQKLVSADASEPCANTTESSGSYWTPRPVPVKVCTRKDMLRTCPPKLCDCPEKTRPKTTGGRLCGALVFLVKGAVTAGLVYWTYSEGLWGDGAQTEDLYYRMLSTVAPSLPNAPDLNNMRLPHLESLKYSLLQHYNRAVFKIMDLVVWAPLTFRERLQDYLSALEEEDATDVPSSEDSMSQGSRG